VRASAAALWALASALALASAPARATIHPSQTIAAPGNDLIEVDGAALAPDGSGGVLYRARVEGAVHLFAIPFANGRWGAPLEVDREDPFGAGQPAIAAGDGGRLLVVWVQARNLTNEVGDAGVPIYALESASLAPGGSGFGEPIVVDPEVGEPFTGNAGHVEPQLAMAPDGSAYVVYRALSDECAIGGLDLGNRRNAECPPDAAGEELMEVRVARYQYLLWTSLGAVNRAPQIAMPNPTPANAPQVGIDVNGNGVVTWQEPSNDGAPARIWARRLFGVTAGTVLSVSPETLGGRPVTSITEAPRIAVSRFGEAKLAFQIDGSRGSAVSTTQLFTAGLPGELDPNGGGLEPADALPGATASGIGAPVPALGPSGEYRFAWLQRGGVHLLSGGPQGEGSPTVLGAGSGAVGTTVNPSGGGTTAWTTSYAGHPAVEALEEYRHGAYQAARLVGGLAGPISGFSFAGSGTGDALIAWMLGPPGDAEVVGDFVQSPPSTLVVSAPQEWVRARGATVSWEPAGDAVEPVDYTVFLDGRPLLRGLRGTRANLRSAVLGDGVHQVQVLASDSAGQRMMSGRATLKIDANPPTVKVALIDHRRGVRVTVADRASGVERAATRIAFGDGARAGRRARATHRYRHPGRYTITAHVRDKAGNSATVHIPVSVR